MDGESATTRCTIGETVHAIAIVCDWAQTRDGVGFNGQDTKFGHRLDSIPEAAWTPEMRWEAHRMLRKYSAQLRRGGIEYDAIEAPERPAGYAGVASDDRIGWAARSSARQMGRLAPRGDGAEVKAPGSVGLLGGKFAVAFPYSDPLVVALKAAVRWQDRV